MIQQVRGAGFTLGYAQALRQLANMLVEQGEGPEALKCIYTGANHRGMAQGRVPAAAIDAALLFWIDCTRELGSILLRQGRVNEAIEEGYNVALLHVKNLHDKRIGDYILGLLEYHLGRLELEFKYMLDKPSNISSRASGPYASTEAGCGLHSSTTIWEKRDSASTTRPSTMRHGTYSRRRLHTPELPPRVHGSRPRRWVWGSFLRAGGYDQAIRNYEQASEMYANLNKKARVRACLLCPGPGDARKENREIAVKLFNQAMEMYEKLKLPAKINEVKFELTKLFMPDGYTSGSIDQILEANDQIQVAKEKRYEVLLREVGEYTLHDWIKRNVRCDVLPELGTVLIGIGDDAAVIRPAGRPVRRRSHNRRGPGFDLPEAGGRVGGVRCEVQRRPQPVRPPGDGGIPVRRLAEPLPAP